MKSNQDSLHFQTIKLNHWPAPQNPVNHIAMAENKDEETERKHQQLKENPETLLEDRNRRNRIINLLFYTPRVPLWKRKIRNYFTDVDKKYIDINGEQMSIYEDEQKQNRYLSVNFYETGIVMIHGKQEDLITFKNNTFNTVKESITIP